MKQMSASFFALVLALLMLGSTKTQVLAEGTAPVAENLELQTYRNVSLGGNLSAYDPEGGHLQYEITTKPVKGELHLEADGSFLYTPGENKRGRDYFGYKVMDEEGNLSQEATVIIRIDKQKSPVSYLDMKEHPAEYAAQVLAEKGIFIGKQVGGSYCFEPEQEICRGEFIRMCMTMLDIPFMPGNLSNWDEPLSTSQAAAIVNESLRISDVSYLSLESALSEAEAQACANLEACGILKQGRPLLETLSREEAAQMLCNALKLLENR